MIKSIALALVTLFTLQFATAQDYTKAVDSDPAAKTILDAVSKKYEGYSTIQTAFELEMAFPEQEVEVQQGILARNGNQYRVTFGTQEIFSDGKAVYLVMHNNKSVQINDMPDPNEDMGFLSPETIFTFYDNGQFVYRLMDTQTEKGKVVHFIEFKPVDRNSEYSKLRMVVERDSKKIVRVLAFAKDGSRYTFKLNKLQPNKKFAAGYFEMNDGKFPGYYVEDLRD